MSKTTFLCIALVCAFGVVMIPGGVVAQTSSDQPTAGDQPAFATSADVTASTIRSLLEAKEFDKAEEMARELTTEHPQVVDGWLLYAYALGVNGKFQESNEAYDAALDRGADRGEVHLRKAYNCRRLGDPEQTRACYDEILEDDPDNIDVLMQYGQFETSVEQYLRAIRRFEAVLAKQPDYLPAIESIASAEKALGNTAQVKFWLEQGLRQEPENAKLLKQISLIYLNEQNYQMTIHYLDKLIAVDPTNVAAHRNKGIALYQQGEKKRAIGPFEKVREYGGDLDGLYGPLADCYRAAGRPGDALTVIREGIDAGSQEAWLYSVWGKILEDRHNYDGAIAKFSKAVALGDEPWSGYARKQIARQTQLKKRAEMIATQGGSG